jgi:hypothetical protein
MKVIRVGGDEYGVDEEFATTYNFRVLVFTYQYGNYEGDGRALGLDGNGTLHEFSLSHCSCYGPWEEHYNSSGPRKPGWSGRVASYFAGRGALEFDDVDRAMRRELVNEAMPTGCPDFGDDLFALHDWLLDHDEADRASQVAALMEQ